MLPKGNISLYFSEVTAHQIPFVFLPLFSFSLFCEYFQIMIQWVIVIIILAIAFIYATYRLYSFWHKPGKTSGDDCDGCSSDCSSCPFNDSEQSKITTRL